MKTIINVSRVIVGLLFIFSGLIKANDPLGLSYKMQEFFEVWNWHALMDFTLPLSIIMISFEIIAGVAVLLGWQMRIFSWLLLILIIFFSFLTGYAVLSGKIKECGCFGDCIPLQAHQSFIKDLVLLALILLIFAYRNRIKPVFNTTVNLSALFFTAIAAIAFQWFVLMHLPVVDCLPYKIGNNIPEKMKAPPGSIPDSMVISYVYKYNNKEVEFTADKFPDDFNDSAYTYLRRSDKLIRKGNAEPAIRDFSLQTISGTDTTQTLLAEDAYQIFLFVKDGYRDGDWSGYMDMISQEAAKKQIAEFLVTNIELSNLQQKSTFAKLTPLRCDATAIKTAARANPTLILIKKGMIVNKWSYADFEKALVHIRNLK